MSRGYFNVLYELIIVLQVKMSQFYDRAYFTQRLTNITANNTLYFTLHSISFFETQSYLDRMLLVPDKTLTFGEATPFSQFLFCFLAFFVFLPDSSFHVQASSCNNVLARDFEILRLNMRIESHVVCRIAVRSHSSQPGEEYQNADKSQNTDNTDHHVFFIQRSCDVSSSRLWPRY